MGKKQTAATQAAKAAKKAKAVQKVERKETKKAFKSKGGPNTNDKGKVNVKKKKKADDSDTDGEDLEGILEKVSCPECTFVCKNLPIHCTPTYARCERNGKLHILSQKNSLKVHRADERMPP